MAHESTPMTESHLSKPRPSLDEIDGGSGREMLPSVSGKFRRLDGGKDYTFLKVNSQVHSERPIEDFMVFTDSIGGGIELPVHAPHWRTITQVAETELQTDDTSIRYYVANTKGVGYLKPLAKNCRIEDYESWIKMDPESNQEHLFGAKVLGLLHEVQPHLIDTTTELTKAGLRCELVWGVADLKQIMYQGQITSLDELKSKGVILNRRDYIPRMSVRLLRSNDRVVECSQGFGDRPDMVMKNAFTTANRERRELQQSELSVEKSEDRLVFLKDFSFRMGANLGILLNEGYSHFWLHPANVTMGAELVDTETLAYWKKTTNPLLTDTYHGVRRAHLKDMRDATYCMVQLIRALRIPREDSHLACYESFMAGYTHASNPVRQESQKTDSVNAQLWMDKILKAVLLERKNLPPLNRNDVSDWNIAL